MKLFSLVNTSGYNADQLNALNQEWTDRVEKLELEEYTDDYNDAAQSFSDDVAARRFKGVEHEQNRHRRTHDKIPG